jgi:signal transduction histidine kinase
MLDPDLTENDKLKYLRILNASGDRLLRTINNYMDISLIVSGNLEVRKSICCPAEIVELLIQSFLEAARLKGITIEAHYPARLKNFLMSTDKDLLNKILMHLLDNALKFSDQGKVIIGFDQRDKVLEFFVKDHGVGVAPEKQEQIFKQFIQGDTSLTRNYEGSGLGLSIVKGMVELLGGHIHLKSKPGVGSEFYFSVVD